MIIFKLQGVIKVIVFSQVILTQTLFIFLKNSIQRNIEFTNNLEIGMWKTFYRFQIFQKRFQELKFNNYSLSYLYLLSQANKLCISGTQSTGFQFSKFEAKRFQVVLKQFVLSLSYFIRFLFVYFLIWFWCLFGLVLLQK